MTPYRLDDAPIFLGIGLAFGLLSFLPDGVRKMKKLLLAILAIALLTAPVSAQTNYLTLAEITVSGTAAAVFTSTDIVAGNGHPAAQSAVCSLTDAAIRVTWDGTTPTGSVGEIVPIGNWTFVGTNVLLNLQAIRNTSTSAKLNCILVRQ